MDLWAERVKFEHTPGIIRRNFVVSALFPSMETNFEARSSPKSKMVMARWKYTVSARFASVYGEGLGGDYFFPALIEYSNDIQNPTHICIDGSLNSKWRLRTSTFSVGLLPRAKLQQS